jgi:hypothetical protein
LTIEFSDDGLLFDPLLAATPDLDRPLQTGRFVDSACISCGRWSITPDTGVKATAIISSLGALSVPPNSVFRRTRVAASQRLNRLLLEIRSCAVCTPFLPLGPRPIVRGLPSASLLIISRDQRTT